MLIRRIIVFLLGILIPVSFSFAQVAGQNQPPVKVKERTMLVKVKHSEASFWEMQVKNLVFKAELGALLGDVSIERVFPRHLTPERNTEEASDKRVDLSCLYRITYQKEFPLYAVIQRFKGLGIFEYVEPEYLPFPLMIPDDEKLTNQYYLALIHAFEAWDICLGDTSMVVGIVDSGSDLDHEDLVDNLKYNNDDPVDGTDNDNDGFTDNFYGWDLGEMDNNPQVSEGTGNQSHGAHMCGIAAATTNNTKGVAGIGFRCKFLPVKVSDANGEFIRCYEGIVYAADQGCQVINCSWGAPYPAGQFGQDIVNYATFNRDALVIAASGNSDNEVPFYPASYENVLNVGATGPDDERMVVYPGYATSFGMYLDLCAPGKNIFNTWNYPYFYKSMSGTSMAAAVASGSAALVRAARPQLNALQIAEILRVTCDVIDTLPANLPFTGKLGMGRINLLKALTDTISPSIRLLQPQFTDMEDEIFEAGDTVYLTGLFHNYLSDAGNVTALLECFNPGVQVIESQVSLGSMASSSSISNDNQPFSFYLLPGIATDAAIELKLTFHPDSFTSFEYLKLNLNCDYLDVQTEKIKTTLTSQAKIGYNDAWNSQGVGFCFKNDLSLLNHGGFLVGTSYSKVSDVLLNNDLSGFDADFLALERIHQIDSPLQADQEFVTVFNDSPAGINSLPIEVTQQTLAWNSEENSRFVIHELKIKNTGNTLLSNLYVGLFADWDINPFAHSYEKVEWYADHALGITSSLSGGPVTGISLLSSGPVTHYAFDMDGAGGSIKVTDGFSTQEKYIALKSNRHQAGSGPGGNNVADQVGSGPHLLLPGDSLIVAFGLLAADHLADIQDAAEQAYALYHAEPGFMDPSQAGDLPASLCYPNPASGIMHLKITLRQPGHVGLILFDEYGRRVFENQDLKGVTGENLFEVPVSKLEPGMYVARVLTEKQKFTVKALILP